MRKDNVIDFKKPLMGDPITRTRVINRTALVRVIRMPGGVGGGRP